MASIDPLLHKILSALKVLSSNNYHEYRHNSICSCNETENAGYIRIDCVDLLRFIRYWKAPF